ncbi:hypothetical protein, partial [Streptomyces sp. JJ36]|uniref:hypothetical protein n=1 Tax=Streptomyces sp. JJ36 TaxID=2736645 RepID=UPI001F30782D
PAGAAGQAAPGPGAPAPDQEPAAPGEATTGPDTPAAEPGGHAAEGPADDGPQPLGVPLEPTGHPPVDAQLRRLEDADHLAVSGHLEVYEDVHRGLRDTLTALDRPDPRS